MCHSLIKKHSLSWLELLLYIKLSGSSKLWLETLHRERSRVEERLCVGEVWSYVSKEHDVSVSRRLN